MNKTKSLYRGHRFPAVVISCALCWYFRFSLCLRDIEELLLERGVVFTYETIRCWCDKFGAGFARCAKAGLGILYSEPIAGSELIHVEDHIYAIR
ncbi:transposase-like protein [Paraburkholderia sp. EB58]|jgi:putative transposase